MIRLLCFILLTFTGMTVLPDEWLFGFVIDHIPIAGDGEDAMNTMELSVLIIKLLISGAGAYVILKAIYWLMSRIQR